MSCHLSTWMKCSSESCWISAYTQKSEEMSALEAGKSSFSQKSKLRTLLLQKGQVTVQWTLDYWIHTVFQPWVTLVYKPWGPDPTWFRTAGSPLNHYVLTINITLVLEVLCPHVLRSSPSFFPRHSLFSSKTCKGIPRASRRWFPTKHSLDPHNAQASLKADSILEHSVLRAAPFSRRDQEAL